MKHNTDSVPRLLAEIGDLIETERRLAQLLERQEEALRAGDPGEILDRSAALAPLCDRLAASAARCRDLAAELGLKRFDDAPERLDPDQAERLLELRRELRLARRESRERAARNRSLAGVSLEAVRSVRRALGATGASNHVGVRVDATA